MFWIGENDVFYLEGKTFTGTAVSFFKDGEERRRVRWD